jgi:predicted GIY-YIG superfamily endonuclease
MNVREIVFPRIRGVYLVADLLHQRAVTSPAWLCSHVYYVGESNDVATRLLGHRSGKHGRNSFVNDPRMILLAETHEGKEERKLLEKRFMGAALKAGFRLLNKTCTLPTPEQIEKWDLSNELALFSEAVGILSVNANPWRHWTKHRCPLLAA